MTDQERNEQFDVRFDGRGYLCVFPPTLRKEQPERQLEVLDEDRPYAKTRRVKVMRAMPGNIRELVARTGCNKHTVNSVLGHLRRDGVLSASKPVGAPYLVYALRTAA